MKNLKFRMERYLAKVDERLGPLVDRSIPSLPLHMRERFSVVSARAFGRNWLFAVENEDWDTGSPTEYRQHWTQLKQATGEDHIAIVLSSLPANLRTRMISLGVPFLIPETQIFLPESVTLLTETFATLPAPGKPLSPAAQVLVLFQIQNGGLEARSAKELSGILDFSRASISNATAELVQNDLCETARQGKEQRICFKETSSGLWEAALPLLRSPVLKTLFVKWEHPVRGAKKAGISALAQRSQIAEDPVPAFALPDKKFRQSLEQGHINGCVDRYEANAEVEVWRYDPALLTEGPDVDPLSLFLSLRNSSDERVQAELDDMMKGLSWL